MPLIVKTKINIGGLSISNNDFTYLTINERLGSHHSIVVECPLSNLEKLGFSFMDIKKYIGSDMDIESEVNGKSVYKYKGIVTALQSARLNLNSGEVITFSGASPTILLDDHNICKSFLDKKLDGIVKDRLGSYPIPNKVKSMFKEKIEYSVQYRETTFDYLCRMSSRFGEWFYYNGEQIVFGSKEDEGKVALEQGQNLNEYSLDVISFPLKDAKSSYDYIEDKIYKSGTQIKPLNDLDVYGKGVKEASETMHSTEGNDIASTKYRKKTALEGEMKLHKAGILSRLVTFSASTKEMALHVGTEIDVKNVLQKKEENQSKGELNQLGLFIVTDVSHFIRSNGDYINNIKAVSADIIHPPPSSNIHIHAECMTAKIIENDDKEKKIGRVKVKFPWMADGEMTPWIRVSNQHANGDRGFYFTPEKDDEVLVDFEGGDPDCPIVIASLNNGKQKPEKWYDADNNIKAIKTKSGNEIYFNDKAGKETIEIFSPNKKNIISLTMDGGANVSIYSDGDINLEAKNNISLKAKNINIKASQKLYTKSKDFINEANSVSVEAQTDLKLSSMDFKSVSNNSATVSSSMNTTINGDVNLDLKGGAITNLKGGLVKIN